MTELAKLFLSSIPHLINKSCSLTPTSFVVFGIDVLGIVPGVIFLRIVAVITTWVNYVVGTFKLRHPEVYGIDDAGGWYSAKLAVWFLRLHSASVLLLFPNTEVPNWHCVYFIFDTEAGILGISIGLNAISTHGACTAVFVAIFTVVGFSIASIRTLGRITWLAWIEAAVYYYYKCAFLWTNFHTISHISPVFIVIIAVGIQDHRAAAPQIDTVWVSDYKIIGNPSFTTAIRVVSSIVFAFSGTPGFFSIVSKMRNPRQYTHALLICQFTLTAIYIIIGCVIYRYCGSYVSSPALGSAGGTVKKISYGFALPGSIVTAIIVTHVKFAITIKNTYQS